MPDFGSFFTEPSLDFDMGRFLTDLFQTIASGLGTVFQSPTWDTIWTRIVEWSGWIYLVDPHA
ncbi:MAG: hypothetical protein LBT21_05760 [Oscillospiraceae bacterium]|jgi:hypothetical protein|nr:hypothetical protein [Oscillospiraceae bacterium]